MGAQTAYVVRSIGDIRRLSPDAAVLRGYDLGDPEVVAISSFRSLSELDLSGCEKVTDRSVSELCQVSSLEKLDLSFCNQITNLSVRGLARLPALRSISLNFCYAVGDSALTALSECKSLESVSLLSCEEVTDAGVEALASLPNLRILDLPEFAAITDGALAVLSASAANLESLRLDHLGGISDEGISRLGRLRHLRNLMVQGCSKVTANAVAALQQALPDCHISFKS